jgi:hypothetical protein
MLGRFVESTTYTDGSSVAKVREDATAPAISCNFLANGGVAPTPGRRLTSCFKATEQEDENARQALDDMEYGRPGDALPLGGIFS